MPQYAMLTCLTPEAVKTPADLKKLEAAVADHVPRTAWVVMIVRSFGHSQTETWTAAPWDRFQHLISAT